MAARVLAAPRAFLAVCVNETAEDAERRLVIGGRNIVVPVRAGRTRLVLFERGTGRIVVATPGREVTATAR